MESQLTKKMKRGLRYFRPALQTKMRTIRFAEEVWTPTGIVDVIRFEDYTSKDSSFCALIDFENTTESEKRFLIKSSRGKIGSCKVDGEQYPNFHCKGCVYHRHRYEVDMLVTCFECKISVSDFKSQNGHNFCGNHNYYVVPNNIVPYIEPLVPEAIGLISYYENSNRYKVVKECVYQPVDDSLKSRLLYDSLKKWVDKFGTEY